MKVDSGRHLSVCPMLAEAQNRLRCLGLEVRGWGVFRGVVGGPALPQCCPMLRQETSARDPGRTVTTRALITNEVFDLLRAQNSKDIILKA